MKQFDLQGNEYDVQIKDMIEPIPNWEYTYVYEDSRTCGKSYIQSLIDEKDKEIERLNNSIEYLLKFIEDMFDEKAISNSFDMTTKEFINYIKSKIKGE